MNNIFLLDLVNNKNSLEDSVIVLNNNYQKILNLSKELEFRLNQIKADGIYINKFSNNLFENCYINSIEVDNAIAKTIPYTNLSYSGTGTVIFRHNLFLNNFSILYTGNGTIQLQWSPDNITYFNTKNYEFINYKTNIIYIKFTLTNASLYGYALFYNSKTTTITENNNIVFKQITTTKDLLANSYLNLPQGITNINNQVEIYKNNKLLIPDIDYLAVSDNTIRLINTIPVNTVLSFYCYKMEYPIQLDNTGKIEYLQKLTDVYNNSLIDLFNNLENTAINVNENLEKVTNLINGIQDKANQYQTETDNMNTSLQNQIDIINTTLDSIITNLYNIQEDLNNYIITTRNTYNNYKTSLSNNINTFNTDFTNAQINLSEDITNINLSLTNVETQVTSLQTLTNSINNKIIGLENQVNNLQIILNTVTGLNTSIATNLNELENAIVILDNDLQNKNTELTNQINQNQEFLNEITNIYNATNNNLYETQDLFTTMFGEIDNNITLINNKITEIQNLPELRTDDIYFTSPEVIYENTIKYNNKLRILVLNDYTLQNKQVSAQIRLPDGTIKNTYESIDGIQIPYIKQDGAWIGADGYAFPSAMHYKNPKSYPETSAYYYDNQGNDYYWIKPNGYSNPIKIYCDMTVSNGGWMGLTYWNIDNPWTQAPYVSITRTDYHLGGNWTVGIGDNSNNYGSFASIIGHIYFYISTGSDPLFGNSNVSVYWTITFPFYFTQVFIPNDFQIIRVGSNGLSINKKMSNWDAQDYNSLALGLPVNPPAIDYFTVMGSVATTLTNNAYTIPTNTYNLDTPMNAIRVGIQYDAPNITNALWANGMIFVR